MSAYSDNYQYNNITTNTTTVVKAGSGILHAITINNSVATGTITIFDNTAGSGTKIATITSTGTVPSSIFYDVLFRNGCTIVTAVAAQDITVCFA